MKLKFGNSIVEVPLRAPSRKVKYELYDILEQLPETNVMKLMLKSLGITNAEHVTEEGISEATMNLFKEGILTPDMLTNFSTSTERKLTKSEDEQRDMLYLRAVKVSLNPSELTTERKELFNQSCESEFWQDQDLQEVYSCVDNFRKLMRI